MATAEDRADAARDAFEAYVGDRVADPEDRSQFMQLASRWVAEECAVIERDAIREMREMRAEIAADIQGGW